jgi:hypothetical protein
MSFERWGSLSVSDHLDTKALAANILLYDRLVFPVCTNTKDRDERAYWVDKGWDPDLQAKRLEQLGSLAIQKPWDAYRRQAFRERFAELKSLQSDADQIDAFGLTRHLLAQEQQIALPAGVSHVEVLAAYNSEHGIRQDFSVENAKENVALQAYLVSRKLAFPDLANPDDSVDLALRLSAEEEFRKKRAKLYDWQDYIVAKGYTPKQAVEYMAQLTDEYNGLVAKAHKEVYYRFAFLIGGVALGLIGAGLGQPMAAGPAILALIEFGTLDKKPVIEAGAARPMALFHDIKTRLGIELK